MNKPSPVSMYIRLDKEIINILCCPLCKGSLKASSQKFICEDCASEYPSYNIKQDRSEEKVFDFRIHRPSYCLPRGATKWFDVQKDWEESYFERDSKRDDLEEYLNEINCAKEIYIEEFNIKGRVLDVGGCEGKLRHFLQKDSVPLYVSVDPLINVFQNFESRPNLLKAYPCLNKPCNFLSCHAENLPFIANTFDWVHMRSVLDHFQDPYLALKEAYRVLKPGGSLLIGSTVYGGKSSLKIEDRDVALRHLISMVVCKFRAAGVKSLIEAAIKKIFKRKGWATSHTFDWKYEDLINLLHITEFVVSKEYWEKSPATMCVYLEAKKLI